MEQVFLNRFQQDQKQTLGELLFKGQEVAKTLELSWKGNKNRISCIPTGVYKVVRRTSDKYGEHFHVLDVPQRDYILMHHGNYAGSINPKTGKSDILGCILPGKEHVDINKDGYLDVTQSKDTMSKLLKLLPLEFELIIS